MGSLLQAPCHWLGTHETIPQTGHTGEARLSLTPCLLEEKAVLSLCQHRASRAVLWTVLTLAEPSCFRHALKEGFRRNGSYTSSSACEAAHVSPMCSGVFPKPLSAPATLGMCRSSPSPLLPTRVEFCRLCPSLSFCTAGCRGFSLAAVFGPSCRRALLQHRLSWASTIGKQKPARLGSEPFQPRFLFRCFHFLRAKRC